MNYNKFYQYKDLTKVSAFNYSGTLALTLIDDANNNVYTPVNTTTNTEEIDSAILEDSLSNQEDR